MPSRGNYWQKGGLPDETVKEEDLSQALQAKVNAVGGGSGNWEKVGEATVTSTVASVNVNFSRTVSLDGTDISKLVVVIHEQLLTPSGCKYRFNNLSGSTDWATWGNHMGSATYSGISEASENAIFLDIGSSSEMFTIIEADGHVGESNNLLGHIKTSSEVQSQGAIGFFASNTNISSLTSFQMEDEGAGTNIGTGTSITVYAVTLN